MPQRILIDNLDWDPRAAVISDGRLIAYFNDPGGEALAGAAPPRPGAVVAVKVARVFAERGLASVELDGQPLSLRLGRGSSPKPGRILLATVAAEARESKPPRLRGGVLIEHPLLLADSEGSGLGRSRGLREAGFEPAPELAAVATAAGCRITLRTAAASADAGVLLDAVREAAGKLEAFAGIKPVRPAVIENGPDAIAAARLAFPDAVPEELGAPDAWQAADADPQLEAALEPSAALRDGGELHVSTPPGAAVFDGDTGDGGQTPGALAEAMVPEVARALMLRRIGGPVVVDFPRLDGGMRERIHAGMKAALADDPLDARCHGFVPGGLYTVTRPWRWRPLRDLLAPSPLRLGLDALRLARHAAHHPGGGAEIAIPAPAHAWLSGDGAGLRDAVLKSLAIVPALVPDSRVERPQLIERPR